MLAELHTVGVTPETTVYLYCFKGARASNSLIALREAGVQDVRMYFGSWNEWSRDPALPIETGMPYAAGVIGTARPSPRSYGIPHIAAWMVSEKTIPSP